MLSLMPRAIFRALARSYSDSLAVQVARGYQVNVQLAVNNISLDHTFFNGQINEQKTEDSVTRILSAEIE